MSIADKKRCFPGMAFSLAMLLPAAPAAACLPEEFSGQFAGSHAVELTTAQPKLVLLKQQSRDLKILVNGATPFWLNGPGGRNGTDYVFLETAGESATVELCFYSLFDQSAEGTYRVNELTLSNPDAGLLALLRRFNEAGSTWIGGGAAGLEQAAAEWELLSSARVGEELDDPDMAFQLQLHAALANISLLRFDTALAQLAVLEEEPFSQHPFYYKVPWQIGKIHLRQRDLPAGIDFLEDALALADRILALQAGGVKYDRAEIAAYLGEAYASAMQLDLASRRLQEALEHAAPDFDLLGKIFSNIGYVSIRESEREDLGQGEKALALEHAVDQHLKAVYFSEAARNMDDYQLAENNLAVLYARIGDRRKSLVHFRKVLELFEETANPEWRYFLYSNLSIYSQVLGDYNKAATYLMQSMRLRAETNTPNKAYYHCRLGTLFRLLDDPERARGEHQTCYTLARQEADDFSLLEALLQLSIAALEDGRPDSAESSVRDALALLPGVNDFALAQRTWTQLAKVLLDAGRLDEAESAIGMALEAENDARYFNNAVHALTVAMQIQRARGNTDRAIRYGDAVLARIERMHTELEAERLGPVWSNQTHAAFSTLAGIYLDRYFQSGDVNFLARAFETSERSRDISLRQRLASGFPNDTASQEERKLLALYSDMANLLADTEKGSAIPEIGDLDYYHQHDLIALARLNNVDTLPIPAPASLDTVRERLRDDQLLLYYLETADDLYLMTLTPDGAELRRVTLPLNLAAVLDAGDFLHTTRSFSALQLQELSEALLPDLSRYPRARELLIARDGPLFGFPFSALSPRDAAGGYRPLIDDYALTTIPSPSTYFMDKPHREAEYETEIAIIADPVYKDLQLAALDPALPGNDALRGWSANLRQLPYTAVEARSIQERTRGNTLVFTGTRATRANLTGAAARNARVLHIATHGYFKSTSEDNIGLALSTVDEAGHRDPGFITPAELFGYAFNNELVVISGCDTAMGMEQAGVGLNSLSRGFLAQGVKHVIATLWPVSDRASAEFMAVFYERLQTEKDVTLALQQAQQALSRNPAYRNPYYWAGYILTSASPDGTIALAD
ncbi:MAG: CHAT domain-containing tetratricopeptide repeat protein [Pseudomonadales bacterium]|nr:CHAT domain-containing tetratricopeptide repeat protein [Pseudomonadales bacterium]